MAAKNDVSGREKGGESVSGEEIQRWTAGRKAAIVLDLPLVLGLGPKNIVLLATTLLVCVVTVSTGRTSVMQGAVHLVLFATYLFLACVP